MRTLPAGESHLNYRTVRSRAVAHILCHRFLLKYATRADVDLLKQGSGGFAEARDAIAEYAEPSPLFGLVLYRRKKVLVKYVPEETSRLLQG